MDTFPNNTLTEYTVKLPERVDLAGAWEVGLASITFPHTWFNIGKENHKFYIDKGTGLQFEVCRLPVGYYSSIQEVITRMKKVVDEKGATGFSFKLDKLTQKLTVQLEAKQRISFENHLGVMLGFGKNVVISKTTIAPFVSDLNVGLQSLFVYLNIVESQVVGDVRAPLLRIVPAQGKNGEIITHNYDNPQFHPVVTKEFETIQLLITDDTGRKIPFERGRVVVTLNFKRSSLL